MANIKMYRDDVFIDSWEFDRYFYILRNIKNNTLFVEVDVDSSHSQHPSIIEILFRYVNNTPEIVNVTPKWRITIDETELENRVYRELEVDGSSLELAYDKYNFFCDLK